MGKETSVPWGTWKSGEGLLLFVDISAGLLTAEFMLDLLIIYLRAVSSSFCGLLGDYFISATFCYLYRLILAVSSQKMSVGSKSGNSEDRGTSIPAVGRERWQPTPCWAWVRNKAAFSGRQPTGPCHSCLAGAEHPQLFLLPIPTFSCSCPASVLFQTWWMKTAEDGTNGGATSRIPQYHLDCSLERILTGRLGSGWNSPKSSLFTRTLSVGASPADKH